MRVQTLNGVVPTAIVIESCRPGTNGMLGIDTTFSVLFSYDTPVVIVINLKDCTQKALITSKKWSRTTSKHMSQFLDTLCESTTVVTKTQTYIDDIVSKL